MKTSRLFLAMAATVVAFASCQNEAPVQDNSAKSVKFTAQSIETRTAFGEKEGTSYPTLWTANDENVKISLNYSTPKDAAVTPSSDYKSAKFEAEFTDDESGAYTFYSLSPASVYFSINSKYKSFGISVPNTQTPTATSVDEAAQILVAQSSAFTSWPEEVVFNYSHFTAYGKMSLTNLNLGTAEITSVALTAPEGWAGRWYYYPETGVVEANSASNTITINTTSTSDIWFACAPVDLGGKTITVTVNTTDGPFVKEITWPAGKAFTSGKVYKFAVDMAGITPAATKTYTKVTDKSELTVDSEVIIVASDANFAMSTTQNGNNRAQAGVTKSGDSIDNPGDDVQVFLAKAGTKTNTIAFYTGTQYIYAASSSSNYLRSQNDLDDNASFSLSLDGGKAALVAQGTNTRNTIRYNGSNSTPIFSCYGSATQDDICIYKLEGSGSSTPIFVAIPKHTITISTCTDGSVSATVGGATIASGAEIEEGTVVTITATPESGYKFGSWSITGATAAGSTAAGSTASTTVTVGESDITIGATFEEDGGSIGGGSKTLTLDWNNWSDVSSYSPTEKTFTSDAIEIGYINVMKNGNNGTPSGWAKEQLIQTKSGGFIYNNTSLGTISSVKIYTVANTNPFTLYYGADSSCSSSLASSKATAGTENVSYSSYASKTVTPNQSISANTYEFDLSGQDASYFKYACGSKAVYIYKIVVTYTK